MNMNIMENEPHLVEMSISSFGLLAASYLQHQAVDMLNQKGISYSNMILKRVKYLQFLWYKKYNNESFPCIMGWFLLFNGISTFVGYLMLMPSF